MSVHIGLSATKQGMVILWQKVNGERIQVKPLPVKQFASWSFDERILDGASVVVGCEIQAAADPCSVWQMLENAGLRTIFFDGDGEVMDEDCEQDDEEVPA